MKVFLSWSGDTSREIAKFFSTWLPSVLQSVQPFFSPNTKKGDRWLNNISTELDACSFGLLFITRDNLTASWIMFEAGALSKQLQKGTVCPILFDVTPTDIEGPLEQFQHTLFAKEELFKLISDLNGSLTEGQLSQHVLENTYLKWWPELEEGIGKILKDKPKKESAPPRRHYDLSVETLEIVRDLRSIISTSKSNSQLNPVLRKQIHTTDDFLELWPSILQYINERYGSSATEVFADATPLTLDAKQAVLKLKSPALHKKAIKITVQPLLEKMINDCLPFSRKVVFRLNDPSPFDDFDEGDPFADE